MVLPLVFYNPSLVAATGAKNWVSIGGYTLFQPSEFMKDILYFDAGIRYRNLYQET